MSVIQIFLSLMECLDFGLEKIIV